jgi:lipopolysaccharide/colanic/teichoic acid biosynthesis glycosyltransferase
MILKRLFDICLAIVLLILLSPLFFILALWVILDSRGDVFYTQTRIGKNRKPFRIYKFRSMRPGSDAGGLLTIGRRDGRVTRAGYFLRKTKFDELPQLFNILAGQMSFVGPRPEVEKYVACYDDEQLQVLRIRPGLTDYASLEYIDEEETLGNSNDPESTYIREIMPAKLLLNRRYISERSFWGDILILFRTAAGIARRKK